MGGLSWRVPNVVTLFKKNYAEIMFWYHLLLLSSAVCLRQSLKHTHTEREFMVHSGTPRKL